MKNKLTLAIASIVLSMVLLLLMHLAFYNLTGGYVFAFGGSLYFLIILCLLGTLPLFISLYKSKSFSELMDKENAATNSKDEKWVKHFLIRAWIILAACLSFFGISLFSSDLGSAYIVIYGVLVIAGISFLLLTIEAVTLYRNKFWNRLYCNIFILGMLVFLLSNML